MNPYENDDYEIHRLRTKGPEPPPPKPTVAALIVSSAMLFVCLLTAFLIWRLVIAT